MRDALPAAAFPAVAVPATTAPRDLSPLTRLLWCAAFAVTAVGLAAMAWLAPRVLYADPWRFTQSLLELPWPRNVLASDNGHREILPNLVRYAELVWLHGNQWLQIITGMLLALLSLAGMAYILRRDAAAPVVRAAGVLTGALSLFWVGGQRVLTHANETVHAYLITALLIAGVAALLLALALLPSTVWMGMLGLGMQRVATATATAVAAGVVDPAQVHGETVVGEMLSALPVVQAQRISMFAWPETRYLQGERAGLAGTGVAMGGVALVPVENALGGVAWRIDFDADSSARRLVLQCGQRPVGLALAEAGRWTGWATGPVDAACLSALQLR